MVKPASLSGAKALAAFPAPSRPKGAVTGGVPRLSAKRIAALSRAREGRWQPGLADQPLHSEIFASTGDACGAGLALALACEALRVEKEADDPLAEVDDRRQILWVQDRRSVQRGGRPYFGCTEFSGSRTVYQPAEKKSFSKSA